MLLGQILFVLAALTIAGATAFGVVYGIVRLVTFRILGKELGPRPEPGSADWTLAPPDATVDLGKPSLLTEKRGRIPSSLWRASATASRGSTRVASS